IPVFPDDETDPVEYGELVTFTTEDPRTAETVVRETWFPVGPDDLEASWAAVDAARDPHTDPDSPDIFHVLDDPRTMDQMRADLLADLLLAADPSEVF